MFSLESLHIPDQGILTDYRELHNKTTDLFREWYIPTNATETN